MVAIKTLIGHSRAATLPAISPSPATPRNFHDSYIRIAPDHSGHRVIERPANAITAIRSPRLQAEVVYQPTHTGQVVYQPTDTGQVIYEPTDTGQVVIDKAANVPNVQMREITKLREGHRRKEWVVIDIT